MEKLKTMKLQDYDPLVIQLISKFTFMTGHKIDVHPTLEPISNFFKIKENNIEDLIKKFTFIVFKELPLGTNDKHLYIDNPVIELDQDSNLVFEFGFSWN